MAVKALRTRIEDAVVDALQRLKAGYPNGYLQAIEPYQGSLEPRSDDPELNRVLNGRTPAVLVTTDDASWPNLGNTLQRAEGPCDVVLLLVSRNLRSMEATARGDALDRDPGLYKILEDVRGWLMGAHVEHPDIGRPYPLNERIVERGEKMILRADFRVRTAAVAYEDATGEYELIKVKGNLPDETSDESANPVAEGHTELEEPEED